MIYGHQAEYFHCRYIDPVQTALFRLNYRFQADYFRRHYVSAAQTRSEGTATTTDARIIDMFGIFSNYNFGLFWLDTV